MLESKNFTQGNIFKQLMELALPIMGTSFLQMAYSFTDMAWLGRLGSRSVAAVGVVSVFLWVANSLALLCKTSSEVTISHSLGKGDNNATNIISSHNTTISIILGVLLSIIYILLMKPLIDIYDLTPDVKQLSYEYFMITNIALPFVFLYLAFFGVYNAAGHSKIPFKILGIGLIINIILDPIMIFSLGWGVVGSAVATLISEVVVCFLFLYHLRKDLLFGGFHIFTRLKKSISRQIFKIGTPVASLNVLFAVVTIYLGRLASEEGGHIAVATLTTGGQLEAITWNTSQGMTTALCSFVGQNFTSGKLQRIKDAFKTALSFTVLVGFIGSLLFIFAGFYLFSLIIPNEETAISGANYLRISGYSQIFMMLEITSQGLLYGLGRSKAPAIISIVGNCIRIPLAISLISSMMLGAVGIWWAISISSILKGVILFLYTLYVMRYRLQKV